MIYNPHTEQAYRLLHDGTLALQRAESQGFRIDTDYCSRKIHQLERKMVSLEEEFKETSFFKHWEHSTSGKVNINSPTQLSNYLYNIKKLKPAKLTETGKGSTDEEALDALNIPELKTLAQKGKLKKCRDVLQGFMTEQVEGVLHPSYNLHLVVSYRSCVAKGTPVLAVRDFQKYPQGVPIEEINVGDYVYCFDDNLKPAIRKVLWSGKTGHREVIRIHYSSNGSHKNGYLDVTPEHRIRLIDGSYVQAQHLVGDFRKESESKKIPKIRTLSCARVDDKLNFTGCIKGGKGIHEHRLIYKELIGDLLEDEIIHHINGIHLDHTPSNLEKTTLVEHSRYHQSLWPEGEMERRTKIMLSYRYKVVPKYGFDNPISLKFSKYTCYRLLAEVAGHPTKINHDFNTLKKYFKLYDIDFYKVMIRFDKHGQYIWKSKLRELAKLQRHEVSKILGHNFYRLLDLYKIYNITTRRRWANQFGEFAPGNHHITKIEWIKKVVDVYDLEVEEFNNFFANEICVHNSANNPNMQNLSKRDPEAMKIIRTAIIPREGNQLMEVDFKQAEVCANACYNKDANLIKYVSDPTTDMHRDLAIQIFKLDEFEKGSHKTLRQAAKNGFVFPQFYGDYYKNCANNLACNWGQLPQGKWKAGQGIEIGSFEPIFLSDHLISKGIKSFDNFTDHIKEIEDDFWGNRFQEYAEWKDRWWKLYQKYGYISLLNGFMCQGVMNKKEVCNYPGQSLGFHFLLWTFIESSKLIEKEKLKSLLIGQVHDSEILDLNPDEAEYLQEKITKIATEDLPNHWKFICVPLVVEFEKYKINGNWAEKES